MAGRVDVARYVVTVSGDGSVPVPPLGVVQVGGLTVAEAQQRLTGLARPLFRYLDLSVSLVGTRSFEIAVSGEVERPGILLVSAAERVQQVLGLAGGVTARGSLRGIVLLRNGREERTVDLLRFQLAGDLSENPYVTEGMAVAVPPRGPSASLVGTVVRAGEYEIGERGSLRELLRLTGGLTRDAAPADARLTRVGPDGKKVTLPLNLDVALKEPGDVLLRSGDSLYVPSLSVVQDVVEVRGAFSTAFEVAKGGPGKPILVQRFELAAGDRVKDIIARAGGVAPYADLRMAAIERNGPSGPRQTIPLDLYRLLVDKDETQNIALQNGDVFTLPATEDKVYVVGEVRNPGPLDYRPNLTSREYIALAGGPQTRSKIQATTVTFPDGRTFLATDAPPLQAGSIVTVPEVSFKWWQDYATIAATLASLVTAYTGLFILFGGAREIQRLNE
jgi:protein involved in polysaccharide export with SLBB domain